MKKRYEIALISLLAILLSYDFAVALKLPKINIANKGMLKIKFLFSPLKMLVIT